MDHTVTFVQGLHALGGFGYVVFGASYALLVVSLGRTLFDNKVQLDVNTTIITICGFVLSSLLVLADKIVSYRFARMRLTLMSSITEKLITATIPQGERIDTAIAQKNIETMLSVIGVKVEQPPS